MTDLDDQLTTWVVDGRTDAGVAVAEVVTVLGDTVSMVVITVIATALLAWRGARAEAVMVGAGSVVGYLVMVACKELFGRDRPPVVHRLLDIDSFSFPSGHAMMTTIVFGLIAVAAYRVSPFVRARPWILLFAPVLAFAVGATRVYLTVHWTTDVLAGWMFGAAWVAICTLIVASRG